MKFLPVDTLRRTGGAHCIPLACGRHPHVLERSVAASTPHQHAACCVTTDHVEVLPLRVRRGQTRQGPSRAAVRALPCLALASSLLDLLGPEAPSATQHHQAGERKSPRYLPQFSRKSVFSYQTLKPGITPLQLLNRLF